MYVMLFIRLAYAILFSLLASVFPAIIVLPLTVFPFYFSDMTSGIPSFVKRSTKYEDLFGEASGSQAPVTAPPASQLPTPLLEQKKASSGGRKRDSKATETGTPSDTRSNKRPRMASARSSPALASSQKISALQTPGERSNP